jgi:hypothetical protein
MPPQAAAHDSRKLVVTSFLPRMGRFDRGVFFRQVQFPTKKRADNAPSTPCRLRGVPTLNSRRMMMPKLCAATCIKYLFAVFATPYNHVLRAPPVSHRTGVGRTNPLTTNLPCVPIGWIRGAGLPLSIRPSALPSHAGGFLLSGQT